MKFWIACYLTMALVSWYLVAGMFFAKSQSIMTRPEWRQAHFRADLGMSIVFGSFYALMWPLGLPAAYLITGFAEHGIWTTR